MSKINMKEKAQEYWRQLQESGGNPCFSTNRNTEIPNALANFALHQCREAIEEACLAICVFCRQPKHWHPAKATNSRFWWNHKAMLDGEDKECEASIIRRRAEELYGE